MTNDELDRSLRQLRMGGMADALAVRAQQARGDNLGPIDFLALLVHDELERRRDRLVGRRVKQAAFRDPKTLDTFNWSFNSDFDRALFSNWRLADSLSDMKTCSCSEVPALERAILPKPSVWPRSSRASM